MNEGRVLTGTNTSWKKFGELENEEINVGEILSNKRIIKNNVVSFFEDSADCWAYDSRYR